MRRRLRSSCAVGSVRSVPISTRWRTSPPHGFLLMTSSGWRTTGRLPGRRASSRSTVESGISGVSYRCSDIFLGRSAHTSRMRLLLPAGVGAQLRQVKTRRFETQFLESLRFPDFLPSHAQLPYRPITAPRSPSRLPVSYGVAAVCEERGVEGRRGAT